MPEGTPSPVLWLLSGLAGFAALCAALLKWQRDGQTIVTQREAERAKNETERAKADTAAHAQALAGMTALCNAQREQMDVLKGIHEARITALEAVLADVRADHADCRAELAVIRAHLGLEA